MKDIKEALETISQGMQAQVPVETLTAFGNSIADLQARDFGKTSEVGMKFAKEKVLTEEGKEKEVTELFGGKKVLVSFVRGSWCPFCNVEMAHLMSYYKELQENDVEVIAISPMNIELLNKWKDEMQMSFSIAQDKDLTLSKALGIDFTLQDFVTPHYEALGIDVKIFNHTDEAELVLPAVYLLDESGVIAFRYMDVNYGTRLDLGELVGSL
ncbi:redoxin domain-containing protein [Myroides sp. M-43]|uniref:redoxin domain-containing protein n=1 Tax=Myroides oncorhynchi TaxID=2893756 RepID=UPI001E553691|nr:redoxin domain-containing protein [Myroides oncorhynchi]MCC9041525.1 redoxin domain-containing protein [Myroides oncorhynchi]